MPTNRTESVEERLRGQFNLLNPASRQKHFAQSPNVSKLAELKVSAFFIIVPNPACLRDTIQIFWIVNRSNDFITAKPTD